MAKINVLDRHTAELIAAGEVVERPSSVIKELVENAIDAGAHTITVEMQNGGTTFMRVTDDGCGIDKEDVKVAFVRHATSKVANKDDLAEISTLGFRGEALASIAAVAKVELLTKSDSDECGTRYIIHGSDEISFEDAGCPRGTTIIVRDLFYNVPARMKFLKRNVSEANAVSSVMDRLALSHMDVAFTLIRDGRKILVTNGDSNLKNTIYSVFGADFTKGLVPVQYSLEGVTVSGFVTKPQCARGSRSMQIFFVNGRFVKSKTASAAVEESSKGTVMVGKYPGCILHIDMPLYAVDVNVHPSKTEIRFMDERPVFTAVYHAVRSAVEQGDTVKELKPKNLTQNLVDKSVVQKPFTMSQHRVEQIKNTPDVVPPSSKFLFVDVSDNNEQKESKSFATVLDGDFGPNGMGTYLMLEDSSQGTRQSTSSQEPPLTILDDTIDFNDKEYMATIEKYLETHPESTAANAQLLNVLKHKQSEVSPTPTDSDGLDGVLDTDKEERKPTGTEKRAEREDSLRGEQSANSDVSAKDDDIHTIIPVDGVAMKYIGEAFKTYIIVERGDDLVFIDKHAAHERIIYEKLKRDEGKRYAQYLIEPVAVTLSKKQYDAVLESAEKLTQSGFEVEDFGQGTVLVRSAPSFLDASDIPATIEEMAEHIIENKRDISTEYMDWLYHTIACRSAIKGGDTTAPEELMRIAAMLPEDTNYRYCPHGRPTSMVITRRELEKQFGRV